MLLGPGGERVSFLKEGAIQPEEVAEAVVYLTGKPLVPISSAANLVNDNLCKEPAIVFVRISSGLITAREENRSPSKLAVIKLPYATCGMPPAGKMSA